VYDDDDNDDDNDDDDNDDNDRPPPPRLTSHRQPISQSSGAIPVERSQRSEWIVVDAVYIANDVRRRQQLW
jgi:hypothetical protein